MQYGTANDSGPDPTRLTSTGAANPATLVLTQTGVTEALRAEGASAGVIAMGNSNGITGFALAAPPTIAVGVKGRGRDGVDGRSRSGGSFNGGVVGTADGLHSNGVIGEANNGSWAYGVWGKSSSGFAGAFNGNVTVFGNLTKSGGGFKIDHPLDPENKYLFHSFVESPEALNVYAGDATTDGAGDATVTLPDYFEELNTDFRYQLTVIGELAHAVVADEIKNNQFSIKTDRPNVKVSWQVAGVRNDPFAKNHRLPIEEEKPDEERGTYLHPGAFGQPETRGAAHAREEAFRAHQAEIVEQEPEALRGETN